MHPPIIIASSRSLPYWARRGALALLALLLLFVLSSLAPVHAQGSPSPATPNAPVDVDVVLDRARVQIDKVKAALDKHGEKPLADAGLVDLRTTAQEAQKQADEVATAIKPQLASVQAREAELGAAEPGAPEAPDVAIQRAQLTKSSSKLDAQLKLARLISLEAGQAVEQIGKLRRSQFQAALGERWNVILAPGYWNELQRDWPRDTVRLAPLGSELIRAAAAMPWWLKIALVIAIGLVLALRAVLERAAMRLSTTRIAPGRLRRSLYAVALVALAVAVPGAIAQLLVMALNWDGSLSLPLALLLGRFVGTVCFGGFLAGLGLALLSPDRPTWRLPTLSDSVAHGLRRYPWLIAVVTVLVWSAEKLATLINLSLSATVALNAIVALALGTTMALALRAGDRLTRAARDDPTTPAAAVQPVWWAGLTGLAWLVLITGLVCVFIGYVALGNFLVKQVLWSAVVLGTAYLVAVLLNDAGDILLANIKNKAGEENASSPATRVRSQVVVLLAGVLRLGVVALAIMLLLAPFGAGPSEWLHRLDYVRATGISIGEVQLRPLALLQSALVLLVGFGMVRLLQRWLSGSYLPTTSLDPGMRVSAATLFGYAGYVLAVALSLSAIGIGLERVAWIASALSVGIGFGLQAVVQNFVSGLILLAERPVKVGDWVTLGTVEGDIRRINVRATEIQMADRSTVIVPNSEFITKVVRNVTHDYPLGRVQIKMTLPLSSDPGQVRELMLSAFTNHPDVQAEPRPSVSLDDVTIDGLVFNATAYVNSPRAVYGVRSALLFDILARLKDAAHPLVAAGAPALPDGPTLPATSAAAPP